MALTLTFRVEMASDFHVGAGHGAGTEIDSALLRDAQGRPVLRGTMLTGLLRDGVWRLLHQKPLGQHQQCKASGKAEGDGYCGQYAAAGYEVCPICRLFGSPRMKKHWRITSARPVDPVATQRVMRVRVSPRTRRAAPNKLFAQEQGGTGAFEFKAICPAEDGAALDEAALLVAAARFVRHLGRSRRRGQGACLLSLIKVEGGSQGLDQQALLERFETAWIHDNLAKPKPADELSDLGGVDANGAQKKVRCRLWARLEEPVIIAQRAMAGNQFEGQPAITGKTLRGALAACAARRYDLADEATYGVFVDLFLRGEVIFPTLTFATSLEVGDSCKEKQQEDRKEKKILLYFPTIPVPADAFECKTYRDHPVRWGTQLDDQLLTCNHPLDGKKGECQSAVKRVKGKWVPLSPDGVRLTEPKQVSEMHIEVDPATGRVTEGRLFEYRGLRAGQVFMGELICASQEAWEQLKMLTGLAEEGITTIHLGKGTQQGYGKVSLWLEPLAENGPASPIGQDFDERVAVGSETLTLTLLTAAIVVDPWGRYATGFETAWLKRALEMDVEVVEDYAFAGTEIVDGFNTKLQLPRWRDLALTPGSTVQLRLAQPLTSEQHRALKRLERQGIGLRRNEGYGAIAFNHPVYKGFDGLDAATMAFSPPWTVEKAGEDEEGSGAPIERWCAMLESAALSGCRGEPWRALARWLHANAARPISDLIAAIDNLEEIDAQLVTLMGGPTERGQRKIKTRYDNENGLKQVRILLTQLNDLKEEEMATGVRMLAERLAEETEIGEAS